MTCTPELHCAGPASRDCLRPHRLQAFVFTAARAFTCSPSCAARLPSAPPSLTLPPSARIATSHVQGVPLIHEQEDFGVSSIPRTQHHLEGDWGHWSGACEESRTSSIPSTLSGLSRLLGHLDNSYAGRMPIDDTNHYALNPLAYVPEMGMRSLIDHNRTAITGRMKSTSSQPIPRRNVHTSVCAYVCKHKHPILGCVLPVSDVS